MSASIGSFDEDALARRAQRTRPTTVEDALNALLEEEADDTIEADRCERTTDHETHRAGHCERGLTIF